MVLHVFLYNYLIYEVTKFGSPTKQEIFIIMYTTYHCIVEMRPKTLYDGIYVKLWVLIELE